jgi:hypothetical protein
LFQEINKSNLTLDKKRFEQPAGHTGRFFSKRLSKSRLAEEIVWPASYVDKQIKKVFSSLLGF